MSLRDVGKTSVWLVNAGDVPAFNEAYARAFGEHMPARSTVVSAVTAPGALIEIEAMAWKTRECRSPGRSIPGRGGWSRRRLPPPSPAPNRARPRPRAPRSSAAARPWPRWCRRWPACGASMLGPGVRGDWRASPLLAETLKGLPPAYVATCGHDPLRDEGIAYANRLRRDGVAVEHRHYAGQIHGFLTMGGVMPETTVLIGESAAALRKMV